MTRKRRRLYLVILGMLCLGGAAALVLTAMGDSLVYFYTPADLSHKHVSPQQRMRLGGLVADGSVRKQGTTVHFTVTDLTASIPVVYTGVLPDLFREGQGVVTEGHLEADGVFHATEVLAKHDATYMPKEVVEALKKSGHWQDEYRKP